MDIQFHRIGSDPEFLIVAKDTGGAPPSLGSIYPAHHLVSPYRHIRTESWIGTDGHPATGEIRPLPAHNLRLHLIKIADALGVLRKAVTRLSNRHRQEYTVVAYPTYQGETLGGHIHVGAWTSLPGNSASHLLIAKLHGLLQPLELFFFAQERGDRRDVDLLRFTDGVIPYAMRKYERYLRFEYRYPSTWLHHPDIAFAFLGLAKLALLNHDNIPDHPTLSERRPGDPGAVLRARIRILLAHPRVRISRDLARLPALLERLLSVQSVESRPWQVQFDAWAQLLSGYPPED